MLQGLNRLPLFWIVNISRSEELADKWREPFQLRTLSLSLFLVELVKSTLKMSSTEDDSVASLFHALEHKRNEIINSTQADQDTNPGLSAHDSTDSEWLKLYDPDSQRFYYANTRTNVTQWEVPVELMENTLVDSISYSASFNSKTGAISEVGEQGYFEKRGRPSDREGRQMSAFFDLSTFEQNRIEAAEKKRKLQTSGIDWKKYKEEKKKKRFRLKNSWLYEDE